MMLIDLYFMLLYIMLVSITALFCLIYTVVIFILSFLSANRMLYKERRWSCLSVIGIFVLLTCFTFFLGHIINNFENYSIVCCQFAISVLTVYLCSIAGTERSKILRHKTENIIMLCIILIDFIWAVIVTFAERWFPEVSTSYYSNLDDINILFLNGEQINNMLSLLNIVGIVSVIVIYVVKNLIYAIKKRI